MKSGANLSAHRGGKGLMKESTAIQGNTTQQLEEQGSLVLMWDISQKLLISEKKTEKCV